MKLTNTPHIHDDFDDLVYVMKENIKLMTTPIYTIVDTSLLVDTWLKNLPRAERQHHTCNCCARFIEAYGGMYTIDDDNVHRSIWAVEAPVKYQKAVRALADYVVACAHRDDNLVVTQFTKQERGRIVRQSTVAGKSWIGSSPTGEFTHFQFLVPTQTELQMIHYREAKVRVEVAAARFGRHMQGLEAVLLQLADKRLTGQFDFIKRWFASNGPQRRNLLAGSHDGLTHWSSSTIGSIVDLLEAGTSVQKAVELTQQKLHPLAYQRPQVVKEGQIAAAERAFAEGGWAPSLKRRNLLPSEVPNCAVLWKSKGMWQNTADTPFSAVRASLGGAVYKPRQPGLSTMNSRMTMTWALFAKSILPQAKSIRYETGGQLRTATLTTAQSMSAKPILRYDNPTSRNPVAWWVPVSSNVRTTADWLEVSQVLRNVPEWLTGSVGDTVLLQLSEYVNQGRFYSGLFPELLTHEMREFRAVIERNNGLDTNGDHNLGVSCVQVNGKSPVTLRVLTVTGTLLEVIIDRFE